MRATEAAWIIVVILLAGGAVSWVATSVLAASDESTRTPAPPPVRAAGDALRVGDTDVRIARSSVNASADAVVDAWRRACPGALAVREAPSGQRALACLRGAEEPLRVGWLEPRGDRTSVTSVEYARSDDLRAWLESPADAADVRPSRAEPVLRLDRGGVRTTLYHHASTPEAARDAWRATLLDAGGQVRETTRGLVSLRRGRRAWLTVIPTNDGAVAHVTEEAWR